MKLNVTAYFGSVRLRTRMSLKDAVALDIEKDNYGNTVYEIYYLEEKFLFENLDIAEYDVEKELGANPYCMLKVEYTKPGTFAQSKLFIFIDIWFVVVRCLIPVIVSH